MKVAGLIVLALALSACHRKTKEEQLAAIESAYQSGILTREEYAAKRAAVQPPVIPTQAPVPVPAPATPPPALMPAPIVGPPPPAPASKPSPSPSPSPPPALPAVAKTPAPAPPPPVEKEEPEPKTSSGCPDVEAKGKAVQQRNFDAPVAEVKKAAVAALGKLDFEVHKNRGNEIEASKRRHIGVLIGAGGEKVFLRFEKSGEGTRVIGETKKSFMGRAAQKTWTGAVLAQTACELR